MISPLEKEGEPHEGRRKKKPVGPLSFLRGKEKGFFLRTHKGGGE